MTSNTYSVVSWLSTFLVGRYNHAHKWMVHLTLFYTFLKIHPSGNPYFPSSHLYVGQLQIYCVSGTMARLPSDRPVRQPPEVTTAFPHRKLVSRFLVWKTRNTTGVGAYLRISHPPFCSLSSLSTQRCYRTPY